MRILISTTTLISDNMRLTAAYNRFFKDDFKLSKIEHSQHQQQLTGK